MSFPISYKNENIVGWIFMVLGLLFFGGGIVVGGYRFFPGYTEEIASIVEFLNAEQVDNLSIAVAIFGLLVWLSLKYWMFPKRYGRLLIKNHGIEIKKESGESFEPAGQWQIVIYKRNKPFKSKVMKQEIVNGETLAILKLNPLKRFKFHVILETEREYELFYECIEEIKKHVRIEKPGISQY